MEDTLIIINGSKEIIEAVSFELNQTHKVEHQVTDFQLLGGGSGDSLIYATLASHILYHILNFVKAYLKSKEKSITKIKIGDITMSNPSVEMIEVLLIQIKEKKKKNG